MNKSGCAIFLLLFLTYGYFFHSGGHNQSARLDTARAIIEDHTLHINRFAWNTADVMTLPVPDELKSKYPSLDYFVYAAQDPGAALWAVPLWAGAYKVLGWVTSLEFKKLIGAQYLTTWLGLGFPCAATVVLFFFWLVEMTNRPRLALLVALGLGLGTPLFPYSTIYYSHVLAASMLFICFYSLWRIHANGGGSKINPTVWAVLAGLAGGTSVLLEYPALIPTGLMFIYANFRLKDWRLKIIGVLAAMIPLAILGFYNQAVGGHFIYTPYQEHAKLISNFPNYRHGFLGIVPPSWRALSEILIRPQRGLLFLSPWLFFIVPGMIGFFKNKKLRPEALLFSSIVLAHLIFNSCLGSSYAHILGGHACGPRHMVLVFFFMATFVCFIPSSLEIFLSPFILWSIGVLVASTAVNPEFPYPYSNPIFQYVFPHFFRGIFGVGAEVTFTGEHLVAGSLSWNWGGLLGFFGGLQMVPLAIIWIIFGVYIFKEATRFVEVARDAKIETR